MLHDIVPMMHGAHDTAANVCAASELCLQQGTMPGCSNSTLRVCRQVVVISYADSIHGSCQGAWQKPLQQQHSACKQRQGCTCSYNVNTHTALPSPPPPKNPEHTLHATSQSTCRAAGPMWLPASLLLPAHCALSAATRPKVHVLLGRCPIKSPAMHYWSRPKLRSVLWLCLALPWAH